MITLLGLDPGFAHIGWSILEVSTEQTPDGTNVTSVVKALGLIRTEKSSKKQNVLSANDNFRRAREIAVELRGLLAAYKVDFLCAEAMSFPRNASAAAKVAMTWGVLADITQQFGHPMLMATPKEVKKAVGVVGKDKLDVQKALQLRFGSQLEVMLTAAKVPPSMREHPYDSLASICACMDSEQVRMLLRLTDRQHC